MINSMDLILKGRLLGSGRVPLIHFDIAKFQMSDRVTRQFGFMQGIPSQPKITGTLEKRKKKIEVEDCMDISRFGRHTWII